MWHTQTVAAIGRGHLRQGLPCQDRTWSLEKNGVTAIALADGAGSAPLSQEGAACAVQAACEVLCGQFDILSTTASPMEMRRAVLSAVRGAIAVRARELQVCPADLACTLLAVAVRGDRYLLFHVGDGVICYQKNGKPLVASAPSNGEFANTTTFVTSPEALCRARVLRGVQQQAEGFLLMSDGCEAALYHKRLSRPAPLVSRIMQRTELMNGQASAQWLHTLLQELIAQRTQDDCSIAVLTRRTASFADWQKMTQRQQAAALGITTQNQNKRRRLLRRYAAQLLRGEP